MESTSGINLWNQPLESTSGINPITENFQMFSKNLLYRYREMSDISRNE